jgi:hypothetical protein
MTQAAADTAVSFDEIFRKAVVDGLQSVLGDTARVLSLYLDPAIALKKPDPYVQSLMKIIPVEDKVRGLVLAIAMQLYQSLGLQLEEKGERKLSDYVNEARQYHMSRTSLH